MQLHVLLYGKSKKKMHPIMIDSEKACKNYRDARGDGIKIKDNGEYLGTLQGFTFKK